MSVKQVMEDAGSRVTTLKEVITVVAETVIHWSLIIHALVHIRLAN